MKYFSRWVLLVFVALAGLGASLYVLKGRWQRPKENKQLVQRELTANSSDDPILFAVISPDGRQLAYADRTNGISLLQIDSGERRSFANTADLSLMGWFPDGTHLLVQSSKNMRLLSRMSTLDGSTRALLDATTIVVDAAVSPDGSRISFRTGPQSSEIWVMGADGENPHRIQSTEPAVSFGSVAWSPTSQRIVFGSYEGPVESRQNVMLQSCDRDGHQCSIVMSDTPRLIGTHGLRLGSAIH